VGKHQKVTTMSEHDQSVEDNVLDRQFVTAAANQRSVGEPPDSSL